MILKTAKETPCAITRLAELIATLPPPAVLNMAQDFRAEAGHAQVMHPGSKMCLHHKASTGKTLMRNAADNRPVRPDPGGKSPNIFMPSTRDKDNDLLPKAVEGFLIYLCYLGEVCASPARALVHEDIYDASMAEVRKLIAQIGPGHPLEMSTGMGAMTSKEQFDTVMGYFRIGRAEGATVAHDDGIYTMPGCETADCIQPASIRALMIKHLARGTPRPGDHRDRFKPEAEALAIASDTELGLTAGIWSGNYDEFQRFSKAMQEGRIWCNGYFLRPGHSSFSGHNHRASAARCTRLR